MDPTLLNSYSANEVIRCIHIGLLCVQDNLVDRPTMSSVVFMLNSSSVALETPSAPPFMSQISKTDETSSSSLYPVDEISYVTSISGR
ncbi:non-specific serine/threonine protein kinase [Ranunculus cassubicifolius]